MGAQADDLLGGTVPAKTDRGAADGSHTLLDNRTTPCAVGLIRAAQAIRALEAGSVLEIWTRDRVAPIEIPVWVARDGHEVIRQERVGRWPRGYYLFEVRRRG